MVSSLASFSSTKDMQPWQINNFDATQFVVGNVEGVKPTGERIGPKVEGKSAKIRKGPSRTGLVSFFIKTYVLIDAEGSLGPLVHCIASQDMPEDQIDVHPCGGLGTTRRMTGDPVYIVFAKTRGVNLAFYKWYWSSVVIPFIKSTRIDHNKPEAQVFVNCDGEDIQIQAFGESSFQDQLEAEKITVDKPPGSTTENTQPLDTGTLFRTVKKLLKSISNDTVRDGAERRDLLANIWQAHQTTYKKLTPDHVKNGIYGVLRVSLAFQRGYNTSRAQDSFRAVGSYPFDKDVILRHCTTPD